MSTAVSNSDFNRALEIGRPPSVKKLFPNSKALIVSGKVIDQAMRKKGGAMTIAANGRNLPSIAGTLLAAQRASAAVIIEIAKSESNYCMTNMWNLARRVDQMMNQFGITVPVAVHATITASRTRRILNRPRARFPACLRPASPPLPSTPAICRMMKTC